MVQFQNSISESLHIIPSLTCSSIGYLRLIVIEFYHVLTLGWAFGL
jgi:hypothetical protein